MALKLSLLVCVCAFPLAVLSNLSLRQVESGSDSINYKRFHIDSLVVSRYAVTTINSVIINQANKSQELTFQVQLPETAFISSFSMTINDTTYYGVAEEKAKAQQEFEDRQSAGENVGLVEARGTNVFRIRINTAAASESTFAVSYEELIPRRASKFSQVINLNPGKIVEDFQTRVTVIEEQGISSMGGSDYLTITRMSDKEVMYTYIPSIEQQNDDTFGLARDMLIEYVITRSSTGPGLIVVNNCYFAQFFSPSGVSSIPVNIVFVIDTSGSMSGTKIMQTREALQTIINQLRPTDQFTMVTFESEIKVWRDESSLVPATEEYKQQGRSFAGKLEASGGTNFNEGLLRGVDILLGQQTNQAASIPLILMLTDGEPTVGVTNSEEIIANAKNRISGSRISLNCLAFGFSLDFSLLKQLALDNNGIIRQIYEADDATSQLEGFFEEISTPILHTVRFNYPEGTFDVISNIEFPILFDGSELVVAGKFSAAVCTNPQQIMVQVTGTGVSGQLTYQGQVSSGANTSIQGFQPSTERVVAYLSIQQLLEKRTVADTEEKDAIEAKALALALQYNFVTELTSLIVVQEQGDNSENFTLNGNGQVGNGLEEFDLFGRGGPPVLQSGANKDHVVLGNIQLLLVSSLTAAAFAFYA